MVYPVRLMRELQVHTGGSEGMHVFRGFNGQMVAKSMRTNAPWLKRIAYDQYLRFSSLCSIGFMGMYVEACRKYFDTNA